jgi:hypothetical protein
MCSALIMNALSAPANLRAEDLFARAGKAPSEEYFFYNLNIASSCAKGAGAEEEKMKLKKIYDNFDSGEIYGAKNIESGKERNAARGSEKHGKKSAFASRAPRSEILIFHSERQ